MGVEIFNDGDDVETKSASYAGYSPDPKNYDSGDILPSTQDFSGQTMVRGQMLSDEGSLRDDFSGSSITTALTGTVSWTNNSTAVVGVGTSFTTEAYAGQYIKKSADANTLFVRVSYVVDDLNLVLETPYTGTTASAASVTSRWLPLTSGTGAAVTVASSQVTVATGGANGGISSIFRGGDYLPYSVLFRASLSQRINNQTIIIGVQDNQTAAGNKRAQFVFDGTSNTSVKCVTSSSSAAADTETTTVTLPNQATTATAQNYEIDISGNQCTFLINKIVVATHTNHLPEPYDSLGFLVYGTNTSGAASNTNIVVDHFYFSNVNQVEITNSFPGEPIKVQTLGGVYLLDGAQASYSASVTGLTVAATPTDVFTITGSATKTVRILKITANGTQTTAAVRDFLLIKRSTANSGGTSSTLTAVPHDVVNAAATAVVRSYTANPTLGTAVGTVRAQKIFLGTTSGAVDDVIFDFGDRPAQALVLRGTGEVLAVNLNSVASAGSSINLSVEFTEE